ncbi:hypothetical protein Tco_1285501 [Tanacetum coccineum]
MEQYMSKTRADYGSGIDRPKIEDKYSFELKGQFLKELRDNTFSGSDHEDANEHIEKVLEIVDLFHIYNITQDQVMLRAFHMSLTEAASHWLRNKPSGSITTWEDLKTKFLSKYCPPARTAKKREEINNFQQEPNETLYQAWERFKELLMKCPQHYLTEMQKAQLNSLGREIKKVNEKVYAAQVGCEQCKGPHTKDCPLKEEAYYTQFGRPFQGWGYRVAALGFYQRNNTNPSYQERRQYMKETLSKFMSESAKRHKENSNMIKEIRASMDTSIRNQGASIKTLEIQIGQMSKVLQERGFGSLPSSTEANPRDHVKSISTTVEADTNSIRRMRSSQYAVSTSQNSKLIYDTRQTTISFPSHLNDYYYEEKKGSYGPKLLEANSYEASHINNSIPRKEKDPGSFTLPCYINNVCFDNALADLGASVSVMPLSTYLSLGLGELAHTKLTVELAYRTVKYPKGIAENVLVGIGKFVFPVDFIILDMPEDVKVPLILGRPFSRLMGETLVLNRSLDPLYGDYIELNDLNVPLELRRDQVYDLMPTIKEGEVIEEVKVRNDRNMVSKFFRYPSVYDPSEKIRIDCAHNLKFSCMIGFEFIHANFLPSLPINVMSKKLYNSIMKDKIKFRGRNELGDWANVPIFIGNFYVLTNFTVVEDMDPYLDEGTGEVVAGKPFCEVSCVETKRFDGMITIHGEDESVTCQMVRSHSRFKHHTNVQCNKIPPLLKVSEQDVMNGISHSYQKLKGFYKRVLNLGPKYIRDAKTEEWLTHGYRDRSAWFFLNFAQDLAVKKSTTLVKYLESGILAH